MVCAGSGGSASVELVFVLRFLAVEVAAAAAAAAAAVVVVVDAAAAAAAAAVVVVVVVVDAAAAVTMFGKYVSGRESNTSKSPTANSLPQLWWVVGGGW